MHYDKQRVSKVRPSIDPVIQIGEAASAVLARVRSKMDAANATPSATDSTSDDFLSRQRENPSAGRRGTPARG